MPKMITKIEGRGNGIKTNIVNMVDIAKALARPASYTTKYFGCELGAQSKFDVKTGTSHVNGAHDTAKLAGLLENFVKKYVQCYGCGNPETEIIITKHQMLNLKCAACGFVAEVDMIDKLTSFIIKNPPEQKKSSKDKKALRRAEKERLKEREAADEELKKLKKAAKKKDVTGGSKVSSKGASTKKKNNASDEDHSPPRFQADENDHAAAVVDDGDDDGIQWQTDTSAEAAHQRIQEQLSAVTADMVMLSTKETAKSAKKSGMDGQEYDVKGTDAMPSNGGKLKSGNTSPEHEEKSDADKQKNGAIVTDASCILADKIKEYLNKSPTARQLISFMGSLPGTSQEVIDALLEALFDGLEKGFAKLAIKKKNFLDAATKETGSHMVLLSAIENFCGKTKPEAMKEVALILKALYDVDVLQEEFVLKWYQQGLRSEKSSTVWKNAKPFIEWLENAESESE